MRQGVDSDITILQCLFLFYFPWLTLMEKNLAVYDQLVTLLKSLNKTKVELSFLHLLFWFQRDNYTFVNRE